MPRLDLDAAYREHAPAVIASLAKSFGASRLDVIEAAVQDAFIAALEAWRDEVPDRPGAWIHTVAKRRVIDVLRRAALFAPDEIDEQRIAASADDQGGDAEPDDDASLLHMMMACCHPALPVEAAVVLSLRTLCGFPIAALSRALLAEPAAIEKRLMRARQVLREQHVELEPGLDAGDRIDAVLRTLYVLFSEGYSAHAGERQIDHDLCATAIRLTDLVLASERATPAAHALQALFLLQASRLNARIDTNGEIIALHDQDRSRWDRAMIERALRHLAAASSGDVLTAYHLEAAIAACHALAPTYADTDWHQIVSLYDRLRALQPSPVIALQRAIAVGRAHGPRPGLKALQQLSDNDRLEDSAVLAAAAADLKAQLGDTRGARAAYRRALELCDTEPERRFLERKLAELGE